jgi:acyl-CoA thioesterase-1
MTYGVSGLMGKAILALMVMTAPLRAQEVTVLALGDSLTQGYGLIESEGLVPQLQAWLDTQGADARLINAGVSGDTTAGGAARVDWSLTPEVDAMIVTLGGNDLLRGIDPELVRKNLEAILDTARKKDVAVLLVGMRAPGNYGPDYAEAFNAVYPDLAKDYDVSLHPFIFRGLGEGSPDTLRHLFQPDGIHPNAQGVARIVEDLGPSVLALIEGLD